MALAFIHSTHASAFYSPYFCFITNSQDQKNSRVDNQYNNDDQKNNDDQQYAHLTRASHSPDRVTHQTQASQRELPSQPQYQDLPELDSIIDDTYDTIRTIKSVGTKRRRIKAIMPRHRKKPTRGMYVTTV